MSESKKKLNCYDEFDDSPRKKEISLQVLYDYEKHYMELVRKYTPEIEFINGLIQKNNAERTDFYKSTLPEISKKLSSDDAIDDDMRKLWLKRFEDNMDKSFELSQRLINDFALKTLDQFKEEINEKIKGI